MPCNIVCLTIKKSGRDISGIDIRDPLKSDDYPTENKKLIKMISINCPKLIRLTMNVDPKNLSEMRIISQAVHDWKKYILQQKLIYYPMVMNY
jgi:hypothetical protein